MKPHLTTFHCIAHSEGCLKEWKEMSVEDGDQYAYCDNCYAKMCADEREVLNEINPY